MFAAQASIAGRSRKSPAGRTFRTAGTACDKDLHRCPPAIPQACGFAAWRDKGQRSPWGVRIVLEVDVSVR
jgi:hypothetical protein